MQVLMAKLEDEGFKKIYKSPFGEPIRYLIDLLLNESESKTATEMVFS